MKKILTLLLALFAFPAFADVALDPDAPYAVVKPFPVRYPMDSLPGCSIAIGYNALYRQYVGNAQYCNIGIGYQALSGKMTNTAINNTAIGFDSLQFVTSGSSNIAIGEKSATVTGGWTTGSRNIAIGDGVQGNSSANTDTIQMDPEGSVSASGGTGNVLIGTHMGNSGNNMTSLGGDACYSCDYNTTNQFTTIGANVGRTNLGANATGPGNAILIGGNGNSPQSSVLDAATINSVNLLGVGLAHPGSDDTAFGYGALIATTADLNKNAAFGRLSLTGNTSGTDNAAFGYDTCAAVTTGSNNLCFGYEAGMGTLTTGSGNILIGTSSSVTTPSSSTSDEINIGGLLFYNYTSTAVPTISSCGTSPSVDTHANAKSGTVTVGTGTVTACTITFASAYSSWNHCRVTFQTHADAGSYSYSTSAISITGTNMASTLIDYDCDGY